MDAAVEKPVQLMSCLRDQAVYRQQQCGWWKLKMLAGFFFLNPFVSCLPRLLFSPLERTRADSRHCSGIAQEFHARRAFDSPPKKKKKNLHMQTSADCTPEKAFPG